MKTLEYRAARGLEVRADNGASVLRGYAAVFNEPTDIGGWFNEQVAPGAFAKDIAAGQDVRALIGHDSNRVIGRTKAKTLSLAEDDHGLAVEITLPDTRDAADIKELISRGDVDGMSFGFIVRNDKWEIRDGKELRTLLDVELIEVSIVAFPAYQGTSISARSSEHVWQHREEVALDPWIWALRYFEKMS